MDTGHFISFHADSPGNKAHNIVRGDCEGTERREQEVYWHNMSAFLMDSLASLNAAHGGKTPFMLFFFFFGLCWLQLQHVCLVVGLQLTAVFMFWHLGLYDTSLLDVRVGLYTALLFLIANLTDTRDLSM